MRGQEPNDFELGNLSVSLKDKFLNRLLVSAGVVQSIKTVTQSHSEFVAKFAFNYAAACGRRCVTVLHKANVMRLSDGAFLRACRKTSTLYPGVKYCEEKLDKFCLRVVDDPGRYDVLLTPSLYGAVASAVYSALAGGVATVPTASYGPAAAVFSAMGDPTPWLDDPAASRYRNANPVGMIRSAIWMLCEAGRTEAAQRVDAALRVIIQQGISTRESGGTMSCAQFTDAVIRNLQKQNAST